MGTQSKEDFEFLQGFKIPNLIKDEIVLVYRKDELLDRFIEKDTIAIKGPVGFIKITQIIVRANIGGLDK